MEMDGVILKFLYLVDYSNVDDGRTTWWTSTDGDASTATLIDYVGC